ncbi:ABC-type multidrug transport system, ATPase component [Marininema mesophilum]|uniref:ABC-type multidrug transport system, ATPase component n=2 Tax=Marininema mesophilum TaxID=1048340 RepID=A0A1H2YEM8_9BACL|nr:ABC-type multidrug transport system, ATPase component [Marininema mesophilum]
MIEKLNQYLNNIFAPYDGIKSVDELKADLLADLQERFRELKDEGKDDKTAFEMTIDSIGDIEQTIQEVANLSRSLERQVLTNFIASDLPDSDFIGVKAHKKKFVASALQGSDFSGADLTGSLFKASDVREANFDSANLTGCLFKASEVHEANFDSANLTGCNFYVTDLTDASFNKSILVRTNLSMSGLIGVKFSDVTLTDVKLTMTDLKKTIFENCIFEGVDFKYSDLRGLCLDNQTFTGVNFDKAALKEVSFRGATLKNVTFISRYTLSKKYHRAIKTICFDGAMMDKLTYAALKSMEADLSKVTVISEEKDMQDQPIQVKGLRKSYKDLHVLKSVDFEVEKGSIFALLGSNGAGKTTVVKILTTLLKPDGGTAIVNGCDVVSKDDNVRQSISLTGQFAAVDEILTGRENLIMIAKLRHLNHPRQVADDLLKRFGLSDAADRRTSTYSGGMRRRLDIAMSLVGKPQLIFLDEPTSGLDPEARIEVWKVVKELVDSGTTVFLTTQYLEEAEQLADRIAILHEGRIIANGTLEELKKLFPPAKVEYVEKQPSLEEIFLAIISKKEEK